MNTNVVLNVLLSEGSGVIKRINIKRYLHVIAKLKNCLQNQILYLKKCYILDFKNVN